ncbi:hypothetical protein GQX73_g4831 [Xylaria multiplex]|uniref:C2H2-type domain-containing protein n=1 Tax=Xylaria multiplex TaxID=323545 RepID=A0A7C8IS09_9PEZI|nr:hypothetical protein GQX73_g4831 [Xylaria multiplex]
MELDEYCTSCRNQRSSFCGGEWVGGSLLDILPPDDREPQDIREALPSHVPRNYTSGAATPFDNRAISNIGLTSSPLLLPYLLHRTYLISTGTDTGISTDTQSETFAQQGNELAPEQWDVGRDESDPVPVPVNEPFHHSSTRYNDTRPGLPNSSPPSSASLYELFDSGLQHSSETTTRSSAGAFQNTQSHQAGRTVRAKRKHVAVEDIASNASTPSSENNSQTCTITMLPGRIAPEMMPLGWSNPLIDTSVQFPEFPADSQFPSPSFRPAPLTWVSDDDYDFTTLPQPRINLVDCDPSEHPPSSAKPIDIPQSSQGIRGTTDASRYCEACESSGKQRLACPFYKYEPQQHPGCMFKGFKTIGHLGQHLKQNHRLKPNHCKLCWRSFETADLLTNHTQYCIRTGGVSVDDLPEFPRMRLPAEKKWYWGWKKLFGQAAALPHCPFVHPIQDLKAHLWAQYTDLPQPEYIGTDWAGESASLYCANYIEGSSVSTSSDW